MTIHTPTDVRWKGRETWSDEDRELVLSQPEESAEVLAKLVGRTPAAINTLRYNVATTSEREILLTQSARRNNSRWTPRDWEVCRDFAIDELDAAALLSRTPLAIRTRRSEIRNGMHPVEETADAAPAKVKPSIPGLLRQLADAFEERGL